MRGPAATRTVEDHSSLVHCACSATEHLGDIQIMVCVSDWVIGVGKSWGSHVTASEDRNNQLHISGLTLAETRSESVYCASVYTVQSSLVSAKLTCR